MSDFGSPVPPPPPSPWGGSSQPPPPSSFAPPGAPTWGQGTPIGGDASFAGQKPARPAVTVAALLVLVGGALVAVGSFVTWFSVLGDSVNGFTSGGEGDVRDGPFFVTFGILLVVGGVVLLALRRVLGVAIAAIVVAALTIITGFADLGDVLGLKDDFGDVISVGAGLYLCIIGGLVALGGAIAATAKRRR